PPSLIAEPNATQRGSGTRTWKDRTSPSTSAHATPPCASATARATYIPILLPAPVPGLRGTNSVSAPDASIVEPERRADTWSSPSSRSARIVVAPSPAHHASASSYDSNVVFRRAGPTQSRPGSPSHSPAEC